MIDLHHAGAFFDAVRQTGGAIHVLANSVVEEHGQVATNVVLETGRRPAHSLAGPFAAAIVSIGTGRAAHSCADQTIGLVVGERVGAAGVEVARIVDVVGDAAS